MITIFHKLSVGISSPQVHQVFLSFFICLCIWMYMLYMYEGMYTCMYICMLICMYLLYLVWPFGSLYYGDKLSSGISHWKTTVVSQPQVSVNLKVNFVCSTVSVLHYNAFHSFFFVKWGVPGFCIFGEETQKRGAICKGKTNLVQNYASRGGKTRDLCFECKTD